MTDPEPLLPPVSRSRLWPVVTIVLALLAVGILSVGVGALAATPPARQGAVSAPAASAEPDPETSFAPTPGPTVAVTRTDGAVAARTPVSELADPEWIDRVSASTGIPARALAAYAGAVLDVSRTHPGCGIGWNTVAAIGLVESEHGSMNGAHLAVDGTVSPAIIGIPLDGNGTEIVRDTDHGAIDGDAVWDRAVGPLQFIPSTWAQVGRDGNRDGTVDVNQIDDAALSTAAHLCDVGGDLTLPQNWIAAVHAYNPSVEYNNRVAAAAEQYAAAR
ncbi:lytic transglycosylase domain-containing protein [Microbacterium sp. SORGH_AS_0862]|uniref:lytic transglycosylase domain-containing protein n=1 Tax=Microbacterium sp. SORGH_AS_0862 TaxID=3041789 RepID=UPI0027914441|nr:lytic murein transglycosylase [Microbacterium sp. SORGH_AS_0862]MDQ1206034.1 membrane-bound lytic murein transglycosylase B [Microbacterium sp. SORGH_AS_0862]